MADVVRRYSTCRTYEDRGVVVATYVDGARVRYEISRFETVFARGRGLRFRFSDENGELVAAIWMTDNRVQAWFHGKVTTVDTLEHAIGSAKGVTMLASWVIPSLLFGRRLTDRQPAVVDYENGGCGECARVGFPMSRRGTRAVLSVDLEQGLLVRRYTIHDSRTEPGGGPGDVIAYEASLDVADEAALVRELETQPW